MTQATSDSDSESRDVYTGNAVVILDEEGQERSGFLNEFTDANEAQPGKFGAEDGVYCITYQVVAPNNKEAYRRTANLIEAKAAAGGFGNNIEFDEITTSRVGQ